MWYWLSKKTTQIYACSHTLSSPFCFSFFSFRVSIVSWGLCEHQIDTEEGFDMDLHGSWFPTYILSKEPTTITLHLWRTKFNMRAPLNQPLMLRFGKCWLVIQNRIWIVDRHKKEDGKIMEIAPYATKCENLRRILLSVDSPKEFGMRSYIGLESMMLLWLFGTMTNRLRIGGQKLR
jgi:hypothetical protein